MVLKGGGALGRRPNEVLFEGIVGGVEKIN